MAETFQVGELCEAKTVRLGGGIKWVEATVISGLHETGIQGIGKAYAMECPAVGRPPPPWIVWYSTPESLRKIRPPYDGNQIVKWDDCPWQPEKVLINARA
jgi:hypothetical protein